MGLLKNRRKRGQEEPTTAPQENATDSVSELTSDTTEAPAKKKRKPDIISIALAIIMLVGLGIIAYPTFSDWWNSYHMSRAIATYVAAVEETDPKVIEKMFEDARAYNEELLWNSNRYHMTDAQRAEYNSLLNLTGDGVIGYIQIASIGVNLPIYHGTDEGILQVAIGHIEGTSLPVGGPSTHAAVSGHRGLPSAKLFTDIDRLTEGDTFTITVLNQTATYQVDQIRIVLPDNMSDLDIQPAADYVTLITCTPYGINTHRMLVRGHRIDNLAAIAAIPAEAVQIPSYIAVPAVGVPMLFIYLLGLLVHYRLNRRRDKYDEVMQALEHLQHSREVPIVSPDAAAVEAEIEAAAAEAEAAADAAMAAAVEAVAAAEAATATEAEPAAEEPTETTAATEAETETSAEDEATAAEEAVVAPDETMAAAEEAVAAADEVMAAAEEAVAAAEAAAAEAEAEAAAEEGAEETEPEAEAEPAEEFAAEAGPAEEVSATEAEPVAADESGTTAETPQKIENEGGADE